MFLQAYFYFNLCKFGIVILDTINMFLNDLICETKSLCLNSSEVCTEFKCAAKIIVAQQCFRRISDTNARK